MRECISPSSILLSSSFIVACLGLVTPPNSNASYFLVTSQTVAPETELVVHARLTNINRSELCAVDLRILLGHSLDYSTILMADSPEEVTSEIRLLTPALERISVEKYKVDMGAAGCVELTHSVDIPIKREQKLVFIRTDKNVYKPGDDVLIHCIVMSPAHRPYRGLLNMTVSDESEIPVVRWRSIIIRRGIVTILHKIPLIAREEKLTVTVQIHNQTVNHTIRVERIHGRHEKPPFVVKARVPKYHTLHSSEQGKSKDLEVNVVASERCGLPVIGRVTLNISLENSTKLGQTPPTELNNGFRKISLNVDDLKKMLGMNSEESLNDRKVNIEIIVEETGEAKDKNRSESLKIVTKKFTVKFVDQSLVLLFNKYTPLYFKPGFMYTGHVTLKPVEEMAETSSIESEVTIGVKHFVRGSETPVVKNITLKILPNSIAEFSFPVAKEVEKLELEAFCEDKISGKPLKARLENILPFSTLNKEGHLIQIRMNGTPVRVKAGEDVNVTIESSFPINSLHWNIFSQDLLILQGVVSITKSSTKLVLFINIPKGAGHILSICHLVVWTTTPSEEIVADGLYFLYEPKHEPKMELSLKPELIESGGTIEIHLKGPPFSSVIVLMTSEPIPYDAQELEERKRAEKNRMSSETHNLITTHLSSDAVKFCAGCSTFSSLAPDSSRVFNESKGLILSNRVLYYDPSRPWPIPSVKNGTLDDIEPSDSSDVQEFSRSYWQAGYIPGESGEIKFSTTLPVDDGIYTVSVMGFVPGGGLISLEEPVQLLVSSKVLASLIQPQSVVRGEEFVLKVRVFNNQDKEAKVDIELKEKPEFKLICLDGESEREEKDMRRSIDLKPKESRMIPLYMRSSKTTQMPLMVEVKVTSEGFQRNLSAHIPVEYEGYEVRFSETKMLNNFDGKQVMTLDLPKNIQKPLPHSERAGVKIHGHSLGPAIQHVCRDIETPRILAERTKMGFILAAAVIEHISNNSVFNNLLRTNNSKTFPVNIEFENPVDREKCIMSARNSVEYVLNRLSPDGSYKMSPKLKGSICLTLTMLEIIHELRKARTVHRGEVEMMIRWLAAQQKQDGSFEDEQRLLNIRSQSDAESVVLLSTTARVLVALNDAKNNLKISNESRNLIETVSKKAAEFIENSIKSGKHDTDAYSLSWAAYALVHVKSEMLNGVILSRDKLKVDEGDMTYWKVGPQAKSIEEDCAICVETTSLAILTSLAMGDVSGSRRFVNYVISQMRPDGSFVSLMDTLLALRALSRHFRSYHISQEHTQVNLDLKITLSTTKEISLKIYDPFFVGTLHFDNSNITESGPLKIESSGEGIILVQSTVEYNVEVPHIQPTDFDLKVNLKKRDSAHLELHVCVENLKKEIGGVHVAEVPALSGHEFNIEKISNESTRQILYQNDIAYIVFMQLPSSETSCVELELVKQFDISSLAPRHIKIYSILEPSKPVSKPYRDENIETGIKKICSDCKC